VFSRHRNHPGPVACSATTAAFRFRQWQTAGGACASWAGRIFEGSGVALHNVVEAVHQTAQRLLPAKQGIGGVFRIHVSWLHACAVSLIFAKFTGRLRAETDWINAPLASYPPRPEGLVNTDHGAFDNVGSRPLQRRVNGGALGRGDDPLVAAVDIGKINPPPENSVQVQRRSCHTSGQN